MRTCTDTGCCWPSRSRISGSHAWCPSILVPSTQVHRASHIIQISECSDHTYSYNYAKASPPDICCQTKCEIPPNETRKQHFSLPRTGSESSPAMPPRTSLKSTIKKVNKRGVSAGQGLFPAKSVRHLFDAKHPNGAPVGRPGIAQWATRKKSADSSPMAVVGSLTGYAFLLDGKRRK